MEDIVAHRRAGRHRQGAVGYLVLWKGYDASEDTWEPPGNLENSAELLAGYKKKNKLA